MAFLLFLSFGQYAQAQSLEPVSLKVIGKNKEILFSEKTSVSLPQTVGQVSVDIFKTQQIPFLGDVDGIHSIYGIGSDLEILSDSEMKAYGWCYSINGVVPEGFVYQINVTEPHTEIVWFYAYAYYKAGQWISQCVPHSL
jgi:hypothetical protein